MTNATTAIRNNGLSARRSLSAAERARASALICERVCASREFHASKDIACYLPMHDEVDTRDIIERAWCANKRIFAPVLRGPAEMVFCEMQPDSELEQNHLGVWEPERGFLIDAKRLDIVITPTVAFDAQGHRIGMGSAYYDRCFAHLRLRKNWIRPKLIGVAFDCQKVEKIAPNPWDIPLYRVITEF